MRKFFHIVDQYENVESINFSYCNLSPNIVDQIAEYLVNKPKLQELFLDELLLSLKTFEKLFYKVLSCSLKKVKVSGLELEFHNSSKLFIDISAKNAQYFDTLLTILARNPSQISKLKIHFPKNCGGFTDEHAPRFSSFLLSENILLLDFSGSSFSESFVHTLISGIRGMRSLNVLNLKSTSLTSTLVTMLLEEVIIESKLESINFSENNLTDYGSSELLDKTFQNFLENNKNLKVLSLSHCGLTSTTLQHIANGLTINTTLKNLD